MMENKEIAFRISEAQNRAAKKWPWYSLLWFRLVDPERYYKALIERLYPNIQGD